MGHRLSSNGSIALDFQDTCARMWGGFFKNLRPSLLMSPPKHRCHYLQSCVRPVGAFRWSRWPFQSSYAARLDGMQNHMLARLLQTNRLPGEDTDCYFRRRRAICRRLSAKIGRWSDSWARAVCTWVGHVQRGHDPGSWTAPLYSWHAAEWLQLQRVASWPGSSSSRLGTRAGPGRPATRYFEGAKLAELF